VWSCDCFVSKNSSALPVACLYHAIIRFIALQVVKAKAYHAEARQLGAQLRRMTAKAAKLKKAAAALRCAWGWCAMHELATNWTTSRER